MGLSEEDKIRYARMIGVSSIGTDGVSRIKNGSVVIIGCGALGSLAAMYLAGAGVGRVTVVDFDNVDLSNLHRQLFYSESDCGKKKVNLLADRMTALNSSSEIIILEKYVNKKNIREILAGHDFVIDATDSHITKLMVSNAASALNLPYCIGGVEGFHGQIMTWIPSGIQEERHPEYSDMFPPVEENPGMLPCGVAGVVGPAAGVVASVQAAEALKYLAGCGQLLTGRLFTFDLSASSANVFMT